MIYYVNINLDLPVFDEIPTYGCQVGEEGFPQKWKEVMETPSKLDHPFYYCENCKGYIEGKPSTKMENTMGPLCGRRGTSYSCIRCGYELSFIGCIS